MFRKNSLLTLVFSVGIIFRAYSQDTLYYSVENVSEESSTSISSKLASNKDLKQLSEENERSMKLRKDKFLIPFIISQVSKYTIYKAVLPFNNSSQLKEPLRILQIAINVFNNNIEYQFHLSEYDKSVSRILSVSNFFINPEIADYQNTINVEVQKLFDGHGGINKLPVAKIRIDGRLVNGDTTFYRSHEDTIFIDGSSSSDEETPKKLIGYIWRVSKITGSDPNNTDLNAYISDFKFEESRQKLVIKEPGRYTFSLEVSDGITRSVRDSVSIYISVINKPFLELHKANFDKGYQGNLLYSFSKKERFFKPPDFVGYNVTNFDTLSRMVFKYLYSRDKLRKYFLEIKPGTKGNSVVLNHNEKNTALNAKDSSTVKIPGLKVDKSQFSESGYLTFRLNKNITPGNHKYLIYTDFKGVTSNMDTVTVSYKEKSFFNLYGGYERYTGYKGTDYFKGFSINLFQFGFRFYLTQRLSADLNCLFPIQVINYSDVEDQKIGLNFLSGKINYDIPTDKINTFTGGLPLYFTGFIEGYKLQASNNDLTKGYFQFGGGAKIRVQLFENNPKMGVWYLELEKGWYKHFEEDSYITESIGFNIIYGLWRY
jgi:hypothetical protein